MSYAVYDETTYDFGGDIKFKLKHVGALTLWDAVALVNGDDYTGLKIWSGDQLLVKHIIAQRDEFQGKTVLVLGSGAGLAAMAAAKASGSTCVLTDGAEDATELLKQNVIANNMQDRVTCEKMYWGVDEGAMRGRFTTGFDLVIGADLIYTQEVLLPLLTAVDTTLSADGTFYLIYLARGTRRLGDWLVNMARNRLEWCFDVETAELVPFEEDDPESFLFTFRRSEEQRKALKVPVLESARFIVTHAKDVSVDYEGIPKAAQTLFEARKRGGFSLANWRKNELNPKTLDETTVNWIFLVDTLNFSFYNDPGQPLFSVTYRGKEWTGYWTLCACINRALEEGIPFTDATYMRDITVEQMRHIFRGSNPAQPEPPLLEDRLRVVREAGKVLCDKFDGSFVNCIKQAQGSSERLLELIVSNFESYQDEIEADYWGRRVKFYKRAQIVIADIWACFEGAGFGRFDDIDDTITMFADYRVPQALVHIGAIKYSESLNKLLNEGARIPRGDRLECEIRGASIWSVELLKREMRRLAQEAGETAESGPLNAIAIDFYLWDFAKAHSAEMQHIPIHRTRCIYY